MSREEKLFLLECLMRDMRGSFPNNQKDPRLIRALELSQELKLGRVEESILHFITCNDFDGRYFRDSSYGYDYIYNLHNFTSYTIIDKSESFKEEVYLFDYPQCRFEDWYKYKIS